MLLLSIFDVVIGAVEGAAAVLAVVLVVIAVVVVDDTNVDKESLPSSFSESISVVEEFAVILSREFGRPVAMVAHEFDLTTLRVGGKGIIGTL